MAGEAEGLGAGDLVGAVAVGLAGLEAEAGSVAAAAAHPGSETMAKMTLDDVVEQLRAAYGAHLTAVVLYGSAAKGEHTRQSDYNVLLLLDAIDGATLAAASSVARAWRDAGNPPPMTMTVDEWHRSADVFPMEYADILERHRVLYGVAPFNGVQVSKENLRLQLEQQVMGKLLQLRQGALLAGTDGKRQLELLTASLSTMMVLFRAVLRLHGERPGEDNVALATRVGALASFDAASFVRVVQHIRGENVIDAGAAGTLLGSYLAGIEQLDRHLDGFTAQQ